MNIAELGNLLDWMESVGFSPRERNSERMRAIARRAQTISAAPGATPAPGYPRNPVAWKTTHPAVCVPITEDADVAAQWSAHNWPVVEWFSEPLRPRVPTPQQISDYLDGLDRIQRELVEREARLLQRRDGAADRVGPRCASLTLAGDPPADPLAVKPTVEHAGPGGEHPCTYGSSPGHTRTCPRFDASMMRHDPFGQPAQPPASVALSDALRDCLEIIAANRQRINYAPGSPTDNAVRNALAVSAAFLAQEKSKNG
jgi:hypothetical protein